MTFDPRFYDSITDIGAESPDSVRGCIAVSGSHGGMFAAAYASRAGLRAVVLNDAGKGLKDAGIAGVRALGDVGMAGCCVDCMSAEIGSARDAFENGVISYVNSAAATLGITAGQSAKSAVALLENAPSPVGMLAPAPESRFETRVGDTAVLCVDSASLITINDAGRFIVTGSHGGLIGGDPARACKANARFVSFSDAGGGKNDIGLSRLPALDATGIAAVVLDCMSCEIGNATSAFETGVVSSLNETARRFGVTKGQTLKSAIKIVAMEQP